MTGGRSGKADVWLTRGATMLVLAAALAIPLVGYCGADGQVDGKSGAARVASVESPPRSGVPASRRPASAAPVEPDLSALAARGERGLAQPEPPATAARDLPTASAEPPRSGAARPLADSPCGGLRVTLISKHQQGTDSTASVHDPVSERSRRVKVGDRVGAYRVTKIEWDRVWFAGGGGLCSIGMHAGARDAREKVGAPDRDVLGVTPGDTRLARRKRHPKAAAVSASAAAPPAQSARVAVAPSASSSARPSAGPSRQPPGAGSAAEPSAAPVDPSVWQLPVVVLQGVEERTVNEFRLSEAALRAIFELGDELLAFLTTRPVERNGRVVGIELTGLVPDTLLDLVHLQDGDVLEAVDDEPVTSAQQAVRLLEERRHARKVQLHLRRDGQSFTLLLERRRR